MPSPSFLFSVFAIPLFFPIEGKISCYYYYFFVFFLPVWSSCLKLPTLHASKCSQHGAETPWMSPKPDKAQAPSRTRPLRTPGSLGFICCWKALCLCWKGVMRRDLLWVFFPSPSWYPANELYCTTQHPDLCETSRIDAFIDSNLVFQRSLHVTKRAAGVI